MTSEQRDYEKGWGDCSFCRTQRPLSALEQVGRALWACRDTEWCSEAQLIRAHRLAARQEMDSQRPEPPEYAAALAREMGLCTVESPADKKREQNREAMRARRAAERAAKPKPPPKTDPTALAKQRERDRAKALAQRQAQHRKERES